jgi:cytochrome b561
MTKYSKKQITLHWTLVVLFAAQFIFHESIKGAFDKVMDGIAVSFDPLVAGHVAGGIAILLLTVYRFYVRQNTGVPAYPQQGSALTQKLSELEHMGTYALGILMPISGMVAWFGMNDNAAEAHEVMKFMFLALIALHIAGAFSHLILHKNNIFKRMWP